MKYASLIPFGSWPSTRGGCGEIIASLACFFGFVISIKYSKISFAHKSDNL